MKPIAISVLFVFLMGIISCRTVKTGAYKTRTYVWVGKEMNHVHPPYIIDLHKGRKRLVFVGCVHVRDTTHQQFAAIKRHFTNANPQITFNEGGQVVKQYASLNEAITNSGETGCLKFLSDQAGIKMVNGDIVDSLEYKLMLQKYPKDQLFLYYVMERLVTPYLFTGRDKRSFDELYATAVSRWFVGQGFPLADNERSFAYFQNLYKQYMGHPFVLTINEDIEKFDYINDDCHFCAIGRTSKMVRDSNLLAKLDRALDQYDRILVTFGHGHALAIEPALRQIMRRKR